MSEQATSGRGPGALIAKMDNLDRLRFAALALAQPPSSQRRWVQLGNMRGACEILDIHAGSIDLFEREGVLTDEQARSMRKVLAGYLDLRETREDILEERRAEPRDFLWSDALEDEDWRRLRHLARDCYLTLSEGRPPLIDD